MTKLYTIVDMTNIIQINHEDENRKKHKMKSVTTELGELTQHNVKQLKVLNRDIFPVMYNEKFYKDLLDAGPLCKLAYCNDIVVGALCCRFDLSDNRRRLYIMTLGVLPKYRELSLGTVMLKHALKICEDDGHVDSIYLHVQTNNQTALSFYKKFAFEIVSTVTDYYRRLEPSDAYILERKFNKPLPDEQTPTIFPQTVTNVN